jgi:hypothetical protein
MLNSQANQPVITFCPSHPPEKRTSQKEKDLFFGFIMPLLPVKQWQSHRRKECKHHYLFRKKN